MAGVNVCIKCSMFIFNFVFWLCGAIILSIAISIRAGKIGQEILVPGDANLSPFIAVNMLIFVGAVIMILGFLGCCGAIKENQFMMILFFLGLLMILLLQVAAGILATTSKSKTEQTLNKTLMINARLLSSTNENERVFQKVFSELQGEGKVKIWTEVKVFHYLAPTLYFNFTKDNSRKHCGPTSSPVALQALLSRVEEPCVAGSAKGQQATHPHCACAGDSRARCSPSPYLYLHLRPHLQGLQNESQV
nr:tetraspanin-8-like [Odocoileus virginianus texanus]